MALETVPLSVNSDGNLRITRVATGSNPLSAAVLVAGDDLTYSLKTFNLNETEAEVSDPRLTLEQDLTRPGKTKFTCEVNYIFGDAGDVAASVLTQGSTGILSIRYSVPNETEWAAAQIADRVVTYVAGAQRIDPPVENGVQTITQMLYVTAVVLKDQTIVA